MDNSDSDEWADDDEDEEKDSDMQLEAILTKCLFCDDSFSSSNLVWSHCNEKHGVNIQKIVEIHKLSSYSYIKMVNYCRKYGASIIPQLMNSDEMNDDWKSDAFLKPILENDALLWFDIEDLSTNEEETTTGTSAQLEHALEDIEKMRNMMGNLLANTELESLPDDDIYFGSYSHFSIHKEMLQDRVRTDSYRDSIYLNESIFKDKTVLDIGCGTGILSMLAAKAGAKIVFAVDQSDIIYQAMDIVRENNLEEKVKLLKGRMEDIELPVEKVDIIISEWMGYFLLFESMLDTVISTRDKLLSKDGLIFPNFCTMSLVGVNDFQMHQSYVTYWNDVYGFKMSCMQKAVLKEVSLSHLKPESIVTDPVVIKTIDINSCSVQSLDFKSSFELVAKQTGFVTAIVGYFDIWFKDIPREVHFSTSPNSTPTHWKQAVFHLESPIPIQEGEKINGNIICRKHSKDPRSLEIHLTLNNLCHVYFME